MNTKIPWWAKMAAKVILSRVPVEYAFWKRLALFQHGGMESPSYAYAVFCEHFQRVEFPRKSGGFVALELGPGDSMFSALIAHAFGATATYLVDAGNYAKRDLGPYVAMLEYLRSRNHLIDGGSQRSVDRILSACNAHYMTEGLASLRTIPDKSIDFIWSHAVLEHLRRKDILETMREIRRILRDDGICSHRVDLKDHMGGGLNNLRFSEKFWESDFNANSGYYTNRIRFSEMLALFRGVGFSTEVAKVDKWSSLPISRNRLAEQFVTLSDDELLVTSFDVILRPQQARLK